MKIFKPVPVLLSVLLLSACASLSPAPTPTAVDMSALQTSVVQTIVANVTQTAAAMPTATETPVPAPTEAPTQAAPTETPVPSPTPQKLCDDVAFVSDASVADGTHMGVGQTFVKTWRVKNTGSCAWTTNYHISFGFGEKMGGQITALPAAVQPGQETEISVNLVAPQKAGNYFANWKMMNASGIFFGQGLTVMIVVP